MERCRLKLISDGSVGGSKLVVVDHEDIIIPVLFCRVDGRGDGGITTGEVSIDLAMVQVEYDGIALIKGNEEPVSIRSNGLINDTIINNPNGDQTAMFTAMSIEIDPNARHCKAILTPHVKGFKEVA